MSDEQGLVSVAFRNLSVSSKTMRNSEQLSTNQSAWKKELENHMYTQKKGLGVKYGGLDKKNNLVDGLLGLDSPLISNAVLDEYGSENSTLMQKESISKSITGVNSHSTMSGYGGNLTDKIVSPSFVSNTLTAAYIENQNAYKQAGKINTALTGSAEGLSKPDARLAAHDIKPFSVKLLANGELLIRDYKQGVLNKTQLDDVVKEIKRVLNNDFQKLRINGEIVWESSGLPLENNYIVELID